MKSAGLVEHPFREDDLPLRLAALREKRDGLLAEIARMDAEIRTHKPWSWKRFALGLVAPLVVALVLTVFVVTG